MIPAVLIPRSEFQLLRHPNVWLGVSVEEVLIPRSEFQLLRLHPLGCKWDFTFCRDIPRNMNFSFAMCQKFDLYLKNLLLHQLGREPDVQTH